MVSTHVLGGKLSTLCLNCNLLSKRKENSLFFLQDALRPLVTVDWDIREKKCSLNKIRFLKMIFHIFITIDRVS